MSHPAQISLTNREARRTDPTTRWQPGFRNVKLVYECSIPSCHLDCDGAALFCPKHLKRVILRP